MPESGVGAIIGAMGRLERVMDSLSARTKISVDNTKKENKAREKFNLLQDKLYQKQLDRVDKQNDVIKKFNDNVTQLEKDRKAQVDSLKSAYKSVTTATTNTVLAQRLGKVVNDKLGGSQTDEIKKNLDRAKVFSSQERQARKRELLIGQNIANVRAQLAATPGTLANANKLNALAAKMTNLMGQAGTISQRIASLRGARKASIQRAGQAFLKTKHKVIKPGSRRAILNRGSVPSPKKKGLLPGMSSAAIAFTGALRYANAALGISLTVIRGFNKVLNESTSIIHKYSQVSIGGLHASAIMQIRDIQRNVRQGRMLGDEMIKFAKANADMKDSFSKFNVVVEKLTLTFGTAASHIFNDIGKRILDPLAKGVDNFMGFITNLGNADIDAITKFIPIIGGALNGFLKMIKGIGWKTQDEIDKETRDRMMRRKLNFQGIRIPLKPGDLSPLENFGRKNVPHFGPQLQKGGFGIPDNRPELMQKEMIERMTKRFKDRKDLPRGGPGADPALPAVPFDPRHKGAPHGFIDKTGMNFRDPFDSEPFLVIPPGGGWGQNLKPITMTA